MRRTKKEIRERMLEVFNHMLDGGKVLVKDPYDGVVKEGKIICVYVDKTVILCDTVHSDYSIFKITFIPKENEDKKESK